MHQGVIISLCHELWIGLVDHLNDLLKKREVAVTIVD